MAGERRHVLGRAFGFGVFNRVDLVDEEAKQLGGFGGIVLVGGFKFFARQFHQFGDERRMLG